MDQELNFSLCYEQLFQEAEGQIKKCDLREEGPYYLQELSKASGFLAQTGESWLFGRGRL